jgi:hypothetical protein
MIKSLLFLVGTLLMPSSEAQEKFKSSKYGYSLTIPSGWRMKTQTIMPDTDVKIVDDRGNSLVVSLREMSSDYKKVSAIDILSKASDQDLIDIWLPSYDDSYILRRGITVIGGKEFYFAHISCPFEGSLRLIHKMYMYNWNGRSISIDCASISSMTNETSVYFDVMLHTFQFS